MYGSVLSMIQAFGAEELAQVSDRAIPRQVSAELLTAAANGADLSEWTEEEQTAVASALTVITEALADASVMIDGYLRARYGLPLSDVPRLVLKLSRDIARHLLWRENTTDNIKAAYTEALGHLKAIGKGDLDLGLNSVQQPTPTTSVAWGTSAPRSFDVQVDW